MVKKPQIMKKIIFFFALAAILSAFEMVTQVETTYEIKGEVVDQDSGEPMIGIAIQEKGTNNHAFTDIDGKFTIKSPKPCITLILSYVGYKTQERDKVCHDKIYKFEMSQGVVLEEEVVSESKAKPKLEARPLTSYSATSLRATAVVAEKREKRRRNRQFSGRTAGVMPSRAPAPSRPYPGQPLQTEDYSPINENRFLSPLNEPLSTFSIDVDAASYSNIRRFIKGGNLPPKDAVRIEEMVNYFEYDYPAAEGKHPFSVISEMGASPWAPEHRLLHIGMQAKQIPAANLPPSNLVFLIDVSGSMSAANKLPLLKSAFKLLVDQLRPNDKVSIVVYAGAAGLVLAPTKGSDKPRIKEAFDQLQAGGSTAGGAGIKLAYKMARKHFVQQGNNRVILATDGDFNVGASSDGEMVRLIEKERESGVFLTVLGFGMGNYKDNKMQQLANKGNGNHAYIDNVDEAKKVLVNEFGATMYTVAKDVKLQVEFNPAKVQAYRLIGYENRMLNNEDFNDDKKDAGELGAGHTVTAIYEIIPVGVKTEFLTKVDELKYQTPSSSTTTTSDEWCHVKLRYKQPSGTKSRLLEQHVEPTAELANTSDNFRWSAAVAGFGLSLRDSQYKGEVDYDMVRKLAQSAKGKDRNGYRKEFINLVDKADQLQNKLTADK